MFLFLLSVALSIYFDFVNSRSLFSSKKW